MNESHNPKGTENLSNAIIVCHESKTLGHAMRAIHAVLHTRSHTISHTIHGLRVGKTAAPVSVSLLSDIDLHRWHRSGSVFV